MGLDNGICIKNIPKEDIPSFVKSYTDFDNDIEICYWRKCWNIRNDIMNRFHGYDNEYTYLEREDIPAIIKILESWLSESKWTEAYEDNDTIWEYDEYRKNDLIQQIINLKWLYEYLKDYPPAEKEDFYFYDSY